jgi:hypothetical protein
MRVHIRERHKDVRANNAVIKDLYAWLKTVGRPAKRIRNDNENHEDDATPVFNKRPRPSAVDDDDDYFGPGPIPGTEIRPVTRQTRNF